MVPNATCKAQFEATTPLKLEKAAKPVNEVGKSRNMKVMMHVNFNGFQSKCYFSQISDIFVLQQNFFLELASCSEFFH